MVVSPRWCGTLYHAWGTRCLITALEEFGTMSLADVMADAITLAERGFPMHHFMAGNLKEDAEQMRCQWASSAAIFLPGGRPPEPGEVFVQRIWDAPCAA